MIKKIIIIPLALIGLNNLCHAQGKKDIKKYKIKALTETTTRIAEDKETVFKDCYLKFDGNGNTIEDISYKSDGSMKEKSINKYDNENNLIQEEKFDKAGLIEKRIYTYNMSGEKATELVYDRTNSLIKKTTYHYNSKGLKTERKTFDENGKLLSIKKYIYDNQ